VQDRRKRPLLHAVSVRRTSGAAGIAALGVPRIIMPDMARNDDSGLGWVLAALGLVSAGFAAGLHRLIWGLFWIIVLIWWSYLWIATTRHGASFDSGTAWLLAIAPVVVLGLILHIVDGIVRAVFGGIRVFAEAGSSPPTSQPDIQKQSDQPAQPRKKWALPDEK
jgi:hypothetical protein